MSASVIIRDASVEFPVFNSQNRGLINNLLGYKGRVKGAGESAVRTAALSGINLSYSSGDRVALIGENGAGKSTFLRMLSGVYTPLSGEVIVNGSMSTLFDLTLGIDPAATGYDFIVTKLILAGFKKKNIKSKIDDVERFTELGEYMAMPVRVYSSGMLLRLAFAVATLNAPKILLMDEMIGVGDTRFMVKAQSRLERMINETEIIFLASHDESILRRLCNKGIYFKSGRVEFNGSIDEVLGCYSSGVR